MFTQIENPFGAIVPISYSSINTEYSSSNESSNIWKWILGFLVLIGGFIIFLVWKEKNMKPKIISKELKDDENDENISQNV